jgi:hypothetical protein
LGGGDPCRRDGQLALDIRDREAGFHASDDGEPAGVERWAGRPLWRQGEGDPRLHAVRVILTGVEGLHPVEARRRHSDDGERRSAEQHRPTDGVVPAVEMGAPEVFRDDRHRRCGRAVVLRAQESPAQRRRAKGPEEIAGDAGANDRDGSMAARRRHPQVAFRADRVERRVRR